MLCKTITNTDDMIPKQYIMKKSPLEIRNFHQSQLDNVPAVVQSDFFIIHSDAIQSNT
jgi:hypothetical protein